jgi:S-adenosylmethionine synthetase
MSALANVVITNGEVLSPSKRNSETVERKGLGHPDTMADLVAETFCYRYATYCLGQFGFVPNHSADKVTLAGADAVVRLGGYDVVEPIHAYYFGKVTREVGGHHIPVEDIFTGAVDDVLTFATDYPAIRQHTVKHLRAVVGNPIDHHPGYYHPDSIDQLKSIMTTERLANDTVACVGGSSASPVEEFVLSLERYLQGRDFRRAMSRTGSDIKVLAVRDYRHLDVTVCLPFHPEDIESWHAYGERLGHARTIIDDFVTQRTPDGVDTVDLHLNQRDVPGRGYLAPFGTCLGKGDVGAVGRGNRYSGVISSARAISIEAPAGKNAMHHTGKIYTVLSQWLADSIQDKFGVDSEVVVTSRVGNRLDQPSSVVVNLSAGHEHEEAIRSLVLEKVAEVDRVTQTLLATDPLAATAAAYGDNR